LLIYLDGQAILLNILLKIVSNGIGLHNFDNCWTLDAEKETKQGFSDAYLFDVFPEIGLEKN
jgi:hypothetical protein